MTWQDDHTSRGHARSGGATRRSAIRHLAALLILAPLSGLGCQRAMHIRQDDLINNAMHQTRANPSRWEGEPLEVDIVCVNASDLKDDRNDRLAPDSSITCREWYDLRPIRSENDDESSSTFKLSKSHIIMLTDDKKQFGTWKRRSLRGGKIDPAQITVEFGFPGSIHDKRHSVIWVFPKFVGPNGEILPVIPARFDPPGAFERDLHVKIGVDRDSRPEYGQYIENTTSRKLYGGGHEQ